LTVWTLWTPARPSSSIARGYHFGSKEALLNEAITRTCDEWTTRLGQAAFASGSDSPLEQMGASWVAMLTYFEALRPVLVGLVEAVGQSAWSDDLRQELAAHYKTSREQVAAMVRASLGEGAESAGADADVVASFLARVLVAEDVPGDRLRSPEAHRHLLRPRPGLGRKLGQGAARRAAAR
jgi:AcrR family transcriptional regulator